MGDFTTSPDRVIKNMPFIVRQIELVEESQILFPKRLFLMMFSLILHVLIHAVPLRLTVRKDRNDFY